MLMFLRAAAARAAEPPQSAHPRTNEEWTALRARIASFVESSLGDSDISPLCHGRLVMMLDARPPARWAMVYEFDFDDKTYHIGVYGRGVAMGSIVEGQADLDRVIQTYRTLEVNEKMAPSSETWEPVSLSDMLPGGGESVAWEIGTPSGGEMLPLTLELARSLGLAADNSRPPDIWWVLRDILGRSLAVTANLRRPPKTTYTLAEAQSGLTVEDAGDLPLELYRRKVGAPEAREAYAQLQERFLSMTGRRLDIRSDHQLVLGSDDSQEAVLVVEPQVESTSGWIPIENAGAGLWEALVVLAAALPEPGRVVLLDEPATHLHSTWQRLLVQYLKSLNQVVLITHSAFLVPSETLEDLRRVVRLVPTAEGTRAVGIGQQTVPEGWRARWRQILAGSTDARSVLFTRGVILVEGETELGALRRWFNDPAVIGSEGAGLDVHNLMVLSVDGDWNFGPHVSYLHTMGVPWVILADGPALAPAYKNGLLRAFAFDETTGERVLTLVGDQPSETGPFEEWQHFWRRNGVLTVASTFGIKGSGEKHAADAKDSGEIERFLRQLDEELWTTVKSEVTSKVRRGYVFAERLNLDAHPDAKASIEALWNALLARLTAVVELALGIK